MTDRAEIETRVRKVLAEQLAVDEAQVVPDARFAEDLNADSLDLVEAVLALEEEWDIEIPEDEMEQVKTVGAAVDMVATKLGDQLTQPRTVSERPRVVVTGIGPVTPVGHRRRRLLGRHDLGPQRRPPITQFDTDRPAGDPRRRGATLRPDRVLDTKEARRTDRFVAVRARLGFARLGGRRHARGRRPSAAA